MKFLSLLAITLVSFGETVNLDSNKIPSSEHNLFVSHLKKHAESKKVLVYSKLRANEIRRTILEDEELASSKLGKKLLSILNDLDKSQSKLTFLLHFICVNNEYLNKKLASEEEA